MRIAGTITESKLGNERAVALSTDFELRDLFAAFALAGMVAVDESQLGTPEGTARDCYRWADAMMAQRRER